MRRGAEGQPALAAGARSVKRTLAAFLVSLFAVAASPIRAAEDAYEINILLPLTGPIAFLGKTELLTVQLAEKVINARGGIKGRPVKFVVSDDTSSPQVAVQLTSAIAAKKVPVILGSPLAASCAAMGPLVAKTGPVQYCLAPVIHPAAGSFVFATGVSSVESALVLARYFKAKGLTRVAIITATDATGQDMDAAFNAVFGMAENKALTVVAREHFTPSDLSVAAQMSRIKAAAPHVLVTWTIGTPFGTVVQGIRDAGLEIPVSAAQGIMLYAQLAQLAGILPKELIFPGYRSLSPSDVRPGPIHDQQKIMYDAYRTTGARPDIGAATTWDPILIVVDALRALGTDASAEAVRAHIAGLHGFAGVNGIYDFRDGSQRGVGASALVIDRWNAATSEFTAISKPGGGLRAAARF